MTERTRNILFSSVSRFIDDGFPVTSERLYESCEFGIKPAMIRWELQELADTGYLYQTHPSGGRLPTDKAYRFFVRELVDRGEVAAASRRASTLLGELSQGDLQSFVDEVSGYLGLLGVGYEAGKEAFYESGLRSLLANLEFRNKRELLDVVRDFEELPERIAAWQDLWKVSDSDAQEWPRVFIGENPLTMSAHLAVVADRFASHGGEFVFVAVGPKRMDYQKSLALFKALGRAMEKI